VNDGGSVAAEQYPVLPQSAFSPGFLLKEVAMTHDERLIGRRPSDQHVQESRARLDAMFDRRFEQRDALRTERRSLDNASLRVLRGLAGEDPILSSAVKRSQARSAALAKRPLCPPEGTKVRARARLGSISVTFVPPFWPWQWSASTGSATADVGADGNAGTMNFDAWTGDNGKTASTAVALGYYFQPLADNGIMDVFANPSFNYVWDSDNVFDNSHTGAFIGLYVGQYTLSGEFVQAVIDQQISLWNSGGGSDQGNNSGFPLFASTPVDSDHFYEIWVWAGGDAEADGWSAFWGSAALSSANLVVPSISVYAY
jgi:hypothetical protein